MVHGLRTSTAFNVEARRLSITSSSRRRLLVIVIVLIFWFLANEAKRYPEVAYLHMHMHLLGVLRGFRRGDGDTTWEIDLLE